MKTIDGITLDWIYARVKEQDGCLIWAGACAGGDKLPNARIGGVNYVMRRVVWQLTHEKAVPKNRRVTMSCGNPKCIHPDHVKAISVNAGMLGVKKTHKHRANIAHSRRKKSAWSTADICSIRNSNAPAKELSQLHGMEISYVYYIKNNQARQDFTNPYLQLVAQ